MKPKQIYQKCGKVLDLSRNYHLRDDGTFEEFPVEVIFMAGAPALPSMPPHSTESAPPQSTTSLLPNSTTSCHSPPATTPSVSGQKPTCTAANISAPPSPSVEITAQTNIPESGNWTARPLRPRTRKQKKDAAKVSDDILHQKKELGTTSKSRHSTTTTAPSLHSQQPTPTSPPPKEMSGQRKVPKNAKGKTQPLDDKAENEKHDAAAIFNKILSEIYKNADYRSKIMEQINASAQSNKKKRGRPKKVEKRKLEEDPAGHEHKKVKKRGRPSKVSNNPQQSLKSEPRILEQQLTGCEPKKKKPRGGWLKGRPRNLEKRIIWEQQQLKQPEEEAEQQQEPEIQQHEPEIQQQQPETTEDMQQEHAEPANEIQQQESETEKEMQKEQPQASTEMQQQKPTAQAPEEPNRAAESNKAAIFDGLTRIMLQMTKITTDVVQLIAMVSGGSQDD